MEPNNQQVNENNTVNTMPEMPKKEPKKVWALLITLVIVLILILASLYVFGKDAEMNQETMEAENSMMLDEKMEIDNEDTSESIEIEDIEADLDAQMEGVDYSF